MPNAQILCFVKRDVPPFFTPETTPRLVYVTRTLPTDQVHHRILHAHQDVTEILLICGGTGRYLVGETFYNVEAGDVLVYNSGVVHDEFSNEEDAVSSYCMAVTGLRLPGLRENALIPDGAPPLFRVGNEEAGDLRLLFDMMYRCLLEDRAGCEILCHHLMLALLGRIFQLTGDAPRRPPPAAGALRRQVQEYIDAHFREPLTLQDIGKALHVSPYYLSHVFKEDSGYSPMQYLLRRRIGEAQNLLISTELPMARIAEEVGFETQNYFNAQFSKHTGISPRKYRESFVGKKRGTPETRS